MSQWIPRGGSSKTLMSLLALASLAWSADARADTASADRLFKEARALMQQKRYTEACPKLAESFRADPSGGTMLHLALCHKEEGRIATAHQELREALEFAHRDKREDREKAARALMTELEPRLSKLTIAVKPDVMRIAGLEVKRDGVLVKPSDWGSALPVDPGSHTVTAWAPGRKPLLKTVDLRGDAATAAITISELEVDPGGKRPEETPVAGGGLQLKSTADAGKDEGSWSTQRKVGLVIGGIGVAALGVGTVFGLQAASKKSESDDGHCNGNICDDDGIRLRDEAMTSGTISTITFIAGGVATAGGLVLMLAAPSASSEKSAGARITSVGLGPSGGWVRGAW